MSENLATWVSEERNSLFYDFNSAARRAARTPYPSEPESWSIEMGHLADRIREADALLGTLADWREIPWDVWPYFEQITGRPLPAEAWEWMDRYQERNTVGHRLDSVRWVLQFRPAMR